MADKGMLVNTAYITGNQMNSLDIFHGNDALQAPHKHAGELWNSDYNDITKLCRGCLNIENVGVLQDLTCIDPQLIELYEQLTKIKLSLTDIPAKMCPDCILQLTKTNEFINKLKYSYEILERAAQDIKYLNTTRTVEQDNYNFEITKILQNVRKEKYSSEPNKEFNNLENETLKADEEYISDNEMFDSLSVHNADSSSDDEIPLAERYRLDFNKLSASTKRKTVKNTHKKGEKRGRKSKENLENVPENDNYQPDNSQNICCICTKQVRNLTSHLEALHSIDWIKLKCLKCLYKNIDKEKLIKHCQDCHVDLDLTTNKNQDDTFKEELKDETSDCDMDNDPDNQNREDLKEPDDDHIEDTEHHNRKKKRGRPPKNNNQNHEFDCNKCEEGYKTYEEIESHYKAKHSSESTCILCNQEHCNSLSMLYHMMVKHGKLKCCRLCLVSFRNSSELNKHYKSEEHNTKCTVCGEQFKNRKALYEHRRKKHLNPQLENQKYKCPECPKEFANQNNIRRHILVAHNDLRFLCDTCGQSYTTKRNLKLHIQKFHEGVPVETKNTKKNFFCEACGRELKIFHKYAIAMHRAKHKGHNYVCKKCYETFASEEVFKRHVEDLGHQLFECTKCQSQFVREENFKIHLKNHEAPGWNKNMFATWGMSAKLRNEKGEFVCSYCPKVFKDKQRLDNHVRVHTNERPYKCHICAKGFKTWIHRKTHLNIHLGIKKWVCKYCSKAFTNSCTLKGHEMIHTGERPHRCPECKKGFITMSAMKKHRMVHMRSASSSVGKKGNRLSRNEGKGDNEAEEDIEYVYKYEPIFTGSELSYESFTGPQKVEPMGLVPIEKDLSC